MKERNEYLEKMKYYNNLMKYKSEERIGVPVFSASDSLDIIKQKHDSYVSILKHKQSVMFYNRLLVGIAWAIEKANDKFGIGLNLNGFSKHTNDMSDDYEELISLMIDDSTLPEPNPMYQLLTKFGTSIFLYHQLNISKDIQDKIRKEADFEFTNNKVSTDQLIQDILNESKMKSEIK